MSENTSCIFPDDPNVDTIGKHLSALSPLLTEDDIRVVLRRRQLSPDIPFYDLTEREVDLAEAEAYYKLCDIPAGGQTVKDVDGSWSHSESGPTVSSTNISIWYQKYCDLRSKWGEEVLGKRRISIINF